MIEIICILLSYLFFLLLILVPLNLNEKNIHYTKVNLDKIIYNLIINLNLLFLLSLLPTNIKDYALIFIIIYLLFFFFKKFFNKF